MTQSDEKTRPSSLDTETSPKPRGLIHQFRYVIIISLVFTGLSIYYALTFFPELSTLRAVGAGLGFGLFCSMCAATYSQLI
ncbi:MAG: hypothetical protein ACPGQS_00910 [Bradymonadia bacterium]